MSLYDMNTLVESSNVVNNENMFVDFRKIQLFAMSIISSVERLGVLPVDKNRFASRTIKENIPSGMQTVITPVAVLTDVELADGYIKETYLYHYEESLEIINDKGQ